MSGAVVLDTGPLISFLAEGLEHHLWVCEQLKKLRPPLLTCEPVITEATLLFKREGRDTDPIFALIERGILRMGMEIENQLADVRALMRNYRNRPMSLADACLVRLCEMHSNSMVLTFDNGFHIYRQNGNRMIPILMPEV